MRISSSHGADRKFCSRVAQCGKANLPGAPCACARSSDAFGAKGRADNSEARGPKSLQDSSEGAFPGSEFFGSL